jgi:hypothetical protein
LKIVQNVFDVRLTRRLAHHAVLQLTVEFIVELVASLLDPRDELLHIAIGETVSCDNRGRQTEDGRGDKGQVHKYSSTVCTDCSYV